MAKSNLSNDEIVNTLETLREESVNNVRSPYQLSFDQGKQSFDKWTQESLSFFGEKFSNEKD
ncbi:hypothetical protein [Zooshikella harenae]|uniref:Uncharacterized protein n=1 Tax=Zooshikella harenae TaxID=2827238 RepID=A0ABS5ZJ16_9GAMM|nr:hypothetical protein [Zooshikella harenae]MBU2714068.1 hypothetical protein [Zooshikella harenae]